MGHRIDRVVCLWTVILSFSLPLQAEQKKGLGDYKKYLSLYKRPKEIPYPKENPYSKAKADLGRMLFFDTRMSGSNFISCATCHNPAFSWGDGLAKGIGHGMLELGRRSPTLLNSAWSEIMFWDGRADTLELQSLGPIASEKEMHLPLAELERKINAIPGYIPLFNEIFPNQPITAHLIAMALATFERTIVSGVAPFDKWVAGDELAIPDAAKRGFVLYNEKARCALCHSGWRFTDDAFYDIGLKGTDKGRGDIIKGIKAVEFAFKTPTLRNVDLRAPYMHDGSEKTLVDVIKFYDIGGVERRESLSDNIKPLNLNDAEKSDLLTFLTTLTSKDPEIGIPLVPR